VEKLFYVFDRVENQIYFNINLEETTKVVEKLRAQEAISFDIFEFHPEMKFLSTETKEAVTYMFNLDKDEPVYEGEFGVMANELLKNPRTVK
jgi:hypothetical protein